VGVAAAWRDDSERATGAMACARGTRKPVGELLRHLDLDGEAGFGTAVMPTFAMTACKRHHVNADVRRGMCVCWPSQARLAGEL